MEKVEVCLKCKVICVCGLDWPDGFPLTLLLDVVNSLGREMFGSEEENFDDPGGYSFDILL